MDLSLDLETTSITDEKQMELNTHCDLSELFGLYLIKSNGQRSFTKTILNTTEYIMVYFSASWCPPCRRFTPILKSFYNKSERKKHKIEVVMIGLDKTEHEFRKYFKDMSWMAVPYTRTENKQKDIMKIFGFKTIPNIAIIKSDTGKLTSLSGRTQIEQFENGKISEFKPNFNDNNN